MEYKYVFFGRTKTVQVKCPKCEVWQFINDSCDCGFVFQEELNEKRVTEYRSEIPTWRKHIIDSIKNQVFQRDEFICQYCGVHCFDSYTQNKRSVTVDHAYPHSAGGKNNVENLITCCAECNRVKSSKIFNSLDEARNYIKKQRNLY